MFFISAMPESIIESYLGPSGNLQSLSLVFEPALIKSSLKSSSGVIIAAYTSAKATVTAPVRVAKSIIVLGL